ncbi:MAG: dTMP kinase [Coriobacteriales bacterium]|nr:dTMP kinase [Coriobacteriales bacterium]
MLGKGLFITLEGVDGCGKTTQANLLVEALEAAGHEVVRVREPGGARLSEKIRLMLLDPGNDDMCDECELLLYEAARAQNVREVILPALERGATVVCDRFYDSTFAYQAYGRGISPDLVAMANRLGSCGLVPNVTLVFDLDPARAYGRAVKDGADRLEGEGTGFQQLVRAGYAQLAKDEPQRVRIVDACGQIATVHARTLDALRDVVEL